MSNTSGNFLQSSIGKKLVMGITGLFLVSFILVHCFINSLIFVNDGGVTFNEGAEFMAHNPIIRTMEIVLFLGLILHAVQALILTRDNKKARPVQYAVPAGNVSSTWYSRSMGLLGTLLLFFLIVHLKHFWVVSRLTDEITSGRETLFGEMKEVFENPAVVLLYLLGVISLCYHLLHGFQSAFQTLGLNHKKYTPLIKNVGFAFSVITSILFAAMPIAIHFKWIH